MDLKDGAHLNSCHGNGDRVAIVLQRFAYWRAAVECQITDPLLDCLSDLEQE